MLQKTSEFMNGFIDQIHKHPINTHIYNSALSDTVSPDDLNKSRAILRQWLIKWATNGIDDGSVTMPGRFFKVGNTRFSRLNAKDLFRDWDDEFDPADISKRNHVLHDQLEAVTVKEELAAHCVSPLTDVQDAMLNGKDIPDTASALEVAEAVLGLLRAIRSSGVMRDHQAQVANLKDIWVTKLKNALEPSEKEIFEKLLPKAQAN